MAVARTRASGKWTESRYFGFLRSALRRASMRWPPIHDVLELNRRPYRGKRKNVRWEYACAHCGEWRMRKEVHVHHKLPCGTLRQFSDLPAFCENLFCEVDKLEVVCLLCHQNETNANKKTC
jgi:hypothetical protein